MKIITLLNEKGGVGKTTLATHIAAGLAIKGFRVVLADADPQGHATVTMGLKKEPCFHDLLVRDVPFSQALRLIPTERYSIPGETVSGELYVIPSDAETRSIPLDISDAFAVNDRFRQLEGEVDVVVFDTAPTPSLLHPSIYLATDWLIYPTECEFLSFDGLVHSMQNRERFRPVRQNWGMDDIRVLGIVPTKYMARTILHTENLEKLRNKFGDLVLPAITRGTVWGEASQRKQPVFAFAPNTRAAAESWVLVDRVQEVAL